MKVKDGQGFMGILCVKAPVRMRGGVLKRGPQITQMALRACTDYFVDAPGRDDHN